MRINAVKIIFVIVIISLIIMLGIKYNYALKKNVVYDWSIKAVHVFQERIDGHVNAEEMILDKYLDAEDESVKLFLAKLNEADKRIVRGRVQVLRREYGECEYFREVCIEMIDGSKVYIYHGFSESKENSLPIYSFSKQNTCYKFKDDALVNAMNEMINSIVT